MQQLSHSKKLGGERQRAGLPIADRTKGILFDNEISTPSARAIPFERIEARRSSRTPSTTLPLPVEGTREVAKQANSKFVVLDDGHLLLRHEREISNPDRRVHSRSY